MKKRAYFDTFDGAGWPEPDWLAPYFVASPRWAFKERTAEGIFIAEGADGTELLPEGRGRIDIILRVWGWPDLGIQLMYSKSGGGHRQDDFSRGDLSRLRERVPTAHGTLLPVGLIIPFDVAWPGVKEFVENDGRRPDSIDWIAGKALPPEAFPDPGGITR